MARREGLSDEAGRLLRVVALMPLASAGDLAPIMGTSEGWLRRALRALASAGWAASLRWGVTQRPRERWFPTRRAVRFLYADDHRHPTPREEAQAQALAESGRDPGAVAELGRRFNLDHAHLTHLECQRCSPFLGAGQHRHEWDQDGHEHPPWTATARGVQTALRRLAMLEPVYRLAPDLLRSGRVRRPAEGAGHDLRMTDFRLLRHGGFYHAVARYGAEVWVPFTHAGLHVTERALRRKRDHRFWGVGCYSHRDGRYQRTENRIFEGQPLVSAEPSAHVVVAADAWALELAQRTLTGAAPTVFCTADGAWDGAWDGVRDGVRDGACGEAVELRLSRDLVSDPAGHPVVGRPEETRAWLRAHPDVAAIDGRVSHRLFSLIAQFPAMRASWLRRLVGASPREVNDRLGRFVGAGLVAVYDGRYYLAELGMRRAANLSRVLPGMIRRRHGAYLERWYREHEREHNDGVNRLVARFAEEGVAAVAGWRGEINLPDVTQVRPDLLVPVAEGPLGAGPHCLEFERSAMSPGDVAHKLGPYRKMRDAGRPLPLLVVCETARARENFRSAGAGLPMLLTTVERARTGPLTGARTVWERDGSPVGLHCRR